MLQFLKKQWFILVMLLMLLLGSLFPGAGVRLNPGKVTTTGLVIALFFLSGLSLPTETLKEGIQHVTAELPAPVAAYLLNRKRRELSNLEAKRAMGITIKPRTDLIPGQMEVAYDRKPKGSEASSG